MINLHKHRNRKVFGFGWRLLDELLRRLMIVPFFLRKKTEKTYGIFHCGLSDAGIIFCWSHYSLPCLYQSMFGDSIRKRANLTIPKLRSRVRALRRYESGIAWTAAFIANLFSIPLDLLFRFPVFLLPAQMGRRSGTIRPSKPLSIPGEIRPYVDKALGRIAFDMFVRGVYEKSSLSRGRKNQTLCLSAKLHLETRWIKRWILSCGSWSFIWKTWKVSIKFVTRSPVWQRLRSR